MIYHSDQQGSDGWLAARRGVITASRFKDCRDKLKNGAPAKTCLSYAMDIARERVGGMAAPKFTTSPMRFGIEQEPIARMNYEVSRETLVEEVGFITTDDRLFGASVDGLVGDPGVLEIKAMVSSDTLFTAVCDGDISAYTDQCNGAMWLLGRQWVDLVLWAPDLPEAIRMTVRRIERDDDEIAALEADLIEFVKLVSKYERKLRSMLSPTHAYPTPNAVSQIPEDIFA